jgi:hypothetical protein
LRATQCFLTLKEDRLLDKIIKESIYVLPYLLLPGQIPIVLAASCAASGSAFPVSFREMTLGRLLQILPSKHIDTEEFFWKDNYSLNAFQVS